jgi:hypothetical protein
MSGVPPVIKGFSAVKEKVIETRNSRRTMTGRRKSGINMSSVNLPKVESSSSGEEEEEEEEEEVEETEYRPSRGDDMTKFKNDPSKDWMDQSKKYWDHLGPSRDVNEEEELSKKFVEEYGDVHKLHHEVFNREKGTETKIQLRFKPQDKEEVENTFPKSLISVHPKIVTKITEYQTKVYWSGKIIVYSKDEKKPEKFIERECTAALFTSILLLNVDGAFHNINLNQIKTVLHERMSPSKVALICQVENTTENDEDSGTTSESDYLCKFKDW